MRRRVSFIQTVVDKWPGRKYLGIYRFMPLFFALGAVLEFSMIKWRPLGVNFYDVYQKKEAKKLAEQALKEEEEQINPMMPAGASWPSYIGATVCALLSMFAGAQTVHMFYRPLQTFDFKVEDAKRKLKEEAKNTET